MCGTGYEAGASRSHYIAMYRHTPLRTVSLTLMTAHEGRRI